MNLEHLDFAEACAALSLDTEESKPFGAHGFISGLGMAPDVAKSAAQLPIGRLSGVFDIKKGSCFFVVTEKKAPDTKELEKETESQRARSDRMEQMKIIQEWLRRLQERANKKDLVADYL
jgi:parvulin-like peptidyl-prolyl isomerase